MDIDKLDKTGLIRESYNIDGISEAECRSIFLDWALKLPMDIAQSDALEALLAHYAPGNAEHPMTGIMREGLAKSARTGRRGGRAARVGGR